MHFHIAPHIYVRLGYLEKGEVQTPSPADTSATSESDVAIDHLYSEMSSVVDHVGSVRSDRYLDPVPSHPPSLRGSGMDLCLQQTQVVAESRMGLYGLPVSLATTVVDPPVCLESFCDSLVEVRCFARAMSGRIVGKQTPTIEQHDSTVLQTLIPYASQVRSILL